jgi:GTP-binding protein HflX
MLERITRLERNLEQLDRTRRTQRKARLRGRQQAVSLVGYTNTGKSTLLNQLTDAGVLAENRLFATLDPRTRRLDLPGGEVVLVSDTVGFVKKLPTQLVKAFRSTLEVVGEADLLVHVVDAAAADPDAQMEAVRTVLTEIGAGGVPHLVAVNKADLDPEAASRIAKHHPGSVVVSGITGLGIDDLLRAIGEHLRALTSPVELLVPWDRGDVIAAVHREGEVLSEAHEEAGARIRARLDPVAQSRFVAFAQPAPL